MYPGTHATATPDKVAHVMAGSGERVTYRELDERSNRLAQLMWAAGLRPGVADVAVIGVPNEEFGEELQGAALDRLRGRAAPPAHRKLYKRLLRDRYWGKTASRIV